MKEVGPKPEDRDVLYFLVQSFRAHLLKELASKQETASQYQRDVAFRAKALLKDLAVINLELAQMTVADHDEGVALPSWFLVEIVRDLPRLIEKKERNAAKK